MTLLHTIALLLIITNGIAAAFLTVPEMLLANTLLLLIGAKVLFLKDKEALGSGIVLCAASGIVLAGIKFSLT